MKKILVSVSILMGAQSKMHRPVVRFVSCSSAGCTSHDRQFTLEPFMGIFRVSASLNRSSAVFAMEQMSGHERSGNLSNATMHLRHMERIRTEAWRVKESAQREALISEAETELAKQMPSTYRSWFSCWRRRGVWVNDLLNMTWVWRQRSTE